MHPDSATQIKITQMLTLAECLSARMLEGDRLDPTEALTYKALMDFARRHARMLELYTQISIEQLEANFYDEPPTNQRPSRGPVPFDGPEDSGGCEDEEDFGLEDGFDDIAFG